MYKKGSVSLMVKKYYITGNTAQGLVDLFSKNLDGINQTLTLDHSSYKMNTAILQSVIQKYKESTPLEIMKSSICSKYLEGVILRENGIAIIIDIENRFSFTNLAYDHFAEGLRIHDELEQIYIQEMDFKKADQAAENLLEKLLKNTPKEDRRAHTFHRFFGTNTMEGIVNEIPQLIEKLDRVYHIKGRAGTGKSTFMKKIANASLKHGLDVELYHCSFDSNSIDMVLVPKLNICLFDSTDPHAFEPKDTRREEVIDLYEIAVTPGTDEKYQEKISQLTQDYKSFMKKGLQVIKQEGEIFVKTEEAKEILPTELKKAVDDIQLKLNI